MSSFVFLFVVFIFGFRIIRVVSDTCVLSKKALTKFGTFYGFVILLVALKSDGNSLLTGIIGLSLPLALYWIMIFIRYRINRKFRNNFLIFLDRIVLFMRSGKSFHESLQFSINEEKKIFYQKKLQELVHFVVFSQQKRPESSNSFIMRMALELEKIAKIPYQQLENVLSLRKNLKIEDKIRHKSEQVLRQIRLQSLILSVLYIFLLIGLIIFQGFHTHRDLIITSLLLFICGGIWVYWGGRRYKWKV